MGIYLPNMEMPTKCSECLFAKLSPTGESLICNYMLSIVSWDERPFDCPLIEVPPHGRLIDEEAVIDHFVSLSNNEWNQRVCTSWADAFAEAASDICDIPTIIEAEE